MDVPRLSPPGPRRAFAFLLVSILLAGLWSISTPASAAGPFYVSGPITGNRVWGTGDTYVMIGNVTVMPGVTLTVQPGAIVKADPTVRLYVQGTLLANGASGNVVTFAANKTTSPIPWGGIQFNASSTGSVSWASVSRAERAISAIQSSPSISHNVIDSAFFGILLDRSSSTVFGNQINYTNVAVQAGGSGDVVLSGNTITNATGNPALGIYATDLQSVTIWSNTIRSIVAANGRMSAIPGGSGTNGGYAVGILVNGTSTATISWNTITQIVGGQAGNGASNGGGNGGRGGDGGPAGGIVTVGVDTLDVESNTIMGVVGGDGGNGGLSSAAAGGNGGNGGNGGSAAGVQGLGSAASATWSMNFLSGVTAGSAGDGGSATFGSFGNGGMGAEVYGFFTGQAMDGAANWNTVQGLRGGHGGNSSNGARGTAGGSGGPASAFWAFGVDGSASITGNWFEDLIGGTGGAGRSPAGTGGDATGVLIVGDGSPFNLSAFQGNAILDLTGGAGGIGTLAGGSGGSIIGLAAFHVQLDSAWNTIDSLTGGKGGDAFVLANPAGRGGDSTAFIAALAPSSLSSSDTIQTVTKGAKGAGSGNPVSVGMGIYAVGNASTQTQLTVTNATLAGIGDIEINVDNYTEATTVNTPFSSTKLAVQRAGNLTVRNFLAVAVYWPNNVTPVGGARVHVDDDGTTAWDVTTPSGFADWLLVTDRVYVQSPTTIHDNVTEVIVSYAGSGFWDNPRFVNMGTSHTEDFAMIDTIAPTSSADPLPTYENSLTFGVGYTNDDGNGTGVQSVSLWYRTNAGGWTFYASQNVGVAGGFSFTAPSDGTYEFFTIATDVAGNMQFAPSTNNTWTIVDTLRPGSHVATLGTYQTTLSFTVSWEPDPGVTDITSYTVQYNAGSGWKDWLVNTDATSGTFTASSQGVHAFRSIARDVAGNAEVAPAGNDTWTIVDTIRPLSRALPLPIYETGSPFTVSWGPDGDTFDIATYRVQVQDDGGAWTDWIASTTATSASYAGTDGHTYAFRSLATDRAGNAEVAPAGNDSWTIVDMTPPDSTMTPLPAYENQVQFAIAWGPAGGTSDIASYRVQWREDAGTWTDVPGYSDTTATSATFNGGLDGHVYAFRTIARDRAGNLEVPPTGNDTWTVVDTTKPSVTDVAPLGANTNTTPWIEITFSEPMDRNSVVQAFSLTPAMNGAYRWNGDSTRLTFVPARALEGGTTYFVALDSSARDRAGNGMAQSRTFQFSTAGGSTSGFAIADYWWLFVLVGAVAGGTLFMVMRRRSAAASTPAAATNVRKDSDAIIEDVFLLNHRDGVLIKHETRRLRPDVDTDILSGMLTAVQQFVKDALRGDDYADLNEMTVGHMHILIGRGKWLVLAARIEGDGTQTWTAQIERCIKDMEDHHWDQLEDWDGDMGLARVLTPYIKKLLQGGYA